MAVKKSANLKKKDSKKEQIYQQLVSFVGQNGYQVRREKLKTGPGWRVLSGTCRVQDEKMIFVDSILPQDEQIEFLNSKIRELGLQADAPVES